MVVMGDQSCNVRKRSSCKGFIYTALTSLSWACVCVCIRDKKILLVSSCELLNISWISIHKEKTKMEKGISVLHKQYKKAEKCQRELVRL